MAGAEDSREEMIGKILNDFLDCRARGEAVSAASLIVAHPHLAAELREHLSMLDQITKPPPRPPGPMLVPGYQLLQEIGKGGMGVVYKVYHPATKQVRALKMLKDGPLATAAAKRRFQREVELAAQLDHPNIVRILDSGEHDGRDYYVMEYVEGERLDDYTLSHQIDLKGRLRLMQRICAAVNYAHQHGVIHRDLKPGNVLIDAAGEPHIVDFGLARPITPAEDETFRMSVTGQLIGTLPYMAPEQARGSHQEIDVRTDVYALGVVLYELLTGKYPYTVVGQMAEVLRNIAEAEPQRPSTISRRIDDDIETIVLRALAKESDRRYQSAGDLARDIEHYLKNEAIEAKGDDSWYRFSKWLWRHRVACSVAAVFAASLGIGLISARQYAKHRTRLDVMAVEEILAAAVDSPASVSGRFANANDEVKRLAVERIRDNLFSNLETPRYAEKTKAACLAILTEADSFWESLCGGLLWRKGEWLEPCSTDWTTQDLARSGLLTRAAKGPAQQRYAASCLMGQLSESGNGLRGQCVDLADTAADPGAIMAALWAASRCADTLHSHLRSPLMDSEAQTRLKQLAANARNRILIDDISGMVFVQLPSAADFRPGSPASEVNRHSDENQPSRGDPIASIWMGTTEVTTAQFEPFREQIQGAGELSTGQSAAFATNYLPELERNGIPREAAAMCFVTPLQARQYCTWLTERSRQAGKNWRYRLPSEAEWEYACRGGHPGAYCYGNTEAYFEFFAADFSEAPYAVATRMPNAYGLFDMHGNVWEICDSEYVEDYSDLRTRGPAQDKFVQRGGAFYNKPRHCRSAQRNYLKPSDSSDKIGFRVVLEPEAKP